MNKKQPQRNQQDYRNTNQHNASTIYQNPNEQNGQQTNVPKQFEKQLEYQAQSNTTESIKYWFISLGLFVGAFAIYAGVWAVERFALNHEISSHYYEKTYKWAAAVPTSYQVKVPSTAKGIALDLVLQWVMWKGPLMLFTYNCVRLREGAMKWIMFGVAFAICLAADVLLTIFVLNVYNSMIYFGIFSLVTIIMAIVCNISINRIKDAVKDSLLPLLCIGIIHTIQVLALPILYKVYTNNLSSQSALFLAFYAYPVVDLIMYAIILGMGHFTSKEVRGFYSMIHFLLVGYEVGWILLIGYTEVEFYYLISYLIFRNVFVNWVMWRWDNVVKLPALLPGWILPYYFSYLLMFVPFAGVGNIIIGTGYYSLILVNTGTLLYNIPSSLYPSDLFTPSTVVSNFAMNTSFQGDIFKIAALIIWVGSTFSQRYSKKWPQIVYTLLYNMFGIYLFYLGLSTGLTTQSLIAYSLIS